MNQQIAALDRHFVRKFPVHCVVLGQMRIGFRVAAGLSERVIYRELFLNGLTLLDLRREPGGPSLTLSHVAARQEVRDLVAALNLPPAIRSGEKGQ